MAETFTGLKLQGALGKFGAVELSDVEAFVEMPDGKVCAFVWGGGREVGGGALAGGRFGDMELLDSKTRMSDAAAYTQRRYWNQESGAGKGG
eukprot:361535-Chlamydomonas_euryale.AAC.1